MPVLIYNDGKQSLPGLDIDTRVQKIEAEILEGPQKGKSVTLENNFLPLEKGDKFFMNDLITVNGDEKTPEENPRGS